MVPQDPRLPDNVRALRPADAEWLLPPTAPEPWTAPEQAQCFTVRVVLDDLEPLIWRRLAVAGDVTLSELHDVLQGAMGWTNVHLHQFVMGPGERDRRRLPFADPFGESEGAHGPVERDVRLDQVLAESGDRLYYDYDFGDGWEHTITVETVAPLQDDAPRASCLAGARACPPEDVGGVPGYLDVLEALERPGAPVSDWMREVLDWLPDGFYPSAFDLARTDDLVRRAAAHKMDLPDPDLVAAPLREVVSTLDDRGVEIAAYWFAEALQPCELDEVTAAAITAPWRALLDEVGDGLTLTGAGYLRPAMVETLVARLPVRSLYGKANREEHVRPIADLHETARAMGLVRKTKGRLLPTTLGRRLHHDPTALAQHLASRLAPGKRPHERGAEWLTVLAAAGGAEDPYADIAGMLGGIGWRSGDGGPIQWHHAYHSAHFTRAVLGLAGWNPRKHADLEHDPRGRVLAHLAVRA